MKVVAYTCDIIVLFAASFIIANNCSSIETIAGGPASIILPIFGLMLTGINIGVTSNQYFFVQHFYIFGTYVGKGFYYLFATLQWLIINTDTLKNAWNVLLYEIVIVTLFGAVAMFFYAIAFQTQENERNGYVPVVFVLDDEEAMQVNPADEQPS
jgi:hypothetical protein